MIRFDIHRKVSKRKHHNDVVRSTPFLCSFLQPILAWLEAQIFVAQQKSLSIVRNKSLLWCLFIDKTLTLWRTSMAEHCSNAPISLCGFQVTESALHYHNTVIIIITSSSSSCSVNGKMLSPVVKMENERWGIVHLSLPPSLGGCGHWSFL